MKVVKLCRRTVEVNKRVMKSLHKRKSHTLINSNSNSNRITNNQNNNNNNSNSKNNIKNINNSIRL